MHFWRRQRLAISYLPAVSCVARVSAQCQKAGIMQSHGGCHYPTAIPRHYILQFCQFLAPNSSLFFFIPERGGWGEEKRVAANWRARGTKRNRICRYRPGPLGLQGSCFCIFSGYDSAKSQGTACSNYVHLIKYIQFLWTFLIIPSNLVREVNWWEWKS